MTTQNTGWPVMQYPANWLQYDPRSGLWEAKPEVTAQQGFGQFGAWIHDFLEPAFHLFGY